MNGGSSVENYYERNTRRFLRFGGAATSGAIHRQLWGAGVSSAADAARYVNGLLAEALAAKLSAAAVPPVVLDLGCGVGGTVIHLAAAFPAAHVHGVTISRMQGGMAEAAAVHARVAERCEFHIANFESMQLGIEADAAVAIEAFVHSTMAADFFATAAAHLRPGGRLIVVDDFLSASAATSGEASRLAERFRTGWRAPAFMTVEACVRAAAHAGFAFSVERDLGSMIRLNRPRDRMIAALAPACRLLGLSGIPFFGNLIGGNALRIGLRQGLFTYRWLEFVRQAP